MRLQKGQFSYNMLKAYRQGGERLFTGLAQGLGLVGLVVGPLGENLTLTIAGGFLAVYGGVAECVSSARAYLEADLKGRDSNRTKVHEE
jgi:hypothetical protein